MLKKKILFISLVILILTIGVYFLFTNDSFKKYTPFTKNQNILTTKDWKSYKNDIFGYSLKYPSKLNIQNDDQNYYTDGWDKLEWTERASLGLNDLNNPDETVFGVSILYNKEIAPKDYIKSYLDYSKASGTAYEEITIDGAKGMRGNLQIDPSNPGSNITRTLVPNGKFVISFDGSTDKANIELYNKIISTINLDKISE